MKARMFSRKVQRENNSLPVADVTKIYQYLDGSYMPDEYQPQLGADDFRIPAHPQGGFKPHESTRYYNVVLGANGLPQREQEGILHDSDKTLPELYRDRSECCGCSACYAICPVAAISMRPDEEGFLYPVVNATKCVRCYKCVNVCPLKGGF